MLQQGEGGADRAGRPGRTSLVSSILHYELSILGPKKCAIYVVF